MALSFSLNTRMKADSYTYPDTFARLNPLSRNNSQSSSVEMVFDTAKEFLNLRQFRVDFVLAKETSVR